MLSNRLKQCRTARHMSTKELAERAGVDVHCIYKLECKRNPAPHWRTMSAICGALGMTPNQVFPEVGGDDDACS